jgi:predicted kinase
MTKKVTILKGLPASGKSTWAKQLVDTQPGKYKRVSKDELRAMLDNTKWSKANEKFILKTRDTLILLALDQGYHVLVDDTNLHPKHEAAIRELVKGKAIVEVKDFTDVPLETCIERDRHRQNYVGEQVIRKMYRDFLAPKPPVLVADPILPTAIICDLDGTLALLNGRNPYDASQGASEEKFRSADECNEEELMIFDLWIERFDPVFVECLAIFPAKQVLPVATPWARMMQRALMVAAVWQGALPGHGESSLALFSQL